MTSLSSYQTRILNFAINPKIQVIAAVLMLFAIVLFNSFFYIFRPYDGMEVYQEAPLGQVYEVYPNGPSDKAGIQVGDQLLVIDGKLIDPFRSEPRYRAGIKPGDVVNYTIDRQGNQINLSSTIGSYSENLPLLGSYIGVQFLSIGLWLIGLVLLLFAAQDARARLLSLGFLIASLTAAVGGASGWNSFWGANTIQKILLCLLAPIIILAHLTFPSNILTKYRKSIVIIIFTITTILLLSVIMDDWFFTPHAYPFASLYGTYLRRVVLGYFMLSWLIAIALLIRNRFFTLNPENRRQTGIVMWGMVLGFGPFFTLTLLPYLLFRHEYLAGSYTALFLLILPLTYAYVIFQRRLLKVDFIINRAVVWFTLILLILIASIVIFGLLTVVFQLPPQTPLIGGVVSALIALPISSLSKFVQAQVDKILYGSYYDYSTVTSSLSNQLAQTVDRERLVELLTQQLPRSMGIKRAELIITNAKSTKGEEIDGNQENSLSEELCQILLKNTYPIRIGQLWNTLSPEIQVSMKGYEWAEVFAPLNSDSKLQGILILGQRTTGDVYSDQDMHIVATVAEQGALAATNLKLVETLRGLAQQLVRTEEDQRKRIANELHDTTLQELFFVKQKMRKNPNNTELLGYVDELINNLRQVIKSQRPPLLDQGLPLALQGLVEDAQNKVGSTPTITSRSNVDGALSLSDEQATSVFRIAQEALNNAIKHSHARIIEVNLERAIHGTIHLQVRDDGIGASGISPNGKLEKNHFGWALMQERATMIGAELTVHTHLGEGTSIDLEFQP